MALIAGDFEGKAAKAEIGAYKGKPVVRIDMQAVGGEHANKRFSYEGKLDEGNIKYTKRAMMAIGWKGKDVTTFVDDVKKAAKVLPFSAEIATNTYADSGKTSQWTSARFGGSKPLEKIEADKIGDVNRWFSEAGDSSGSGSGDPDIPF